MLTDVDDIREVKVVLLNQAVATEAKRGVEAYEIDDRCCWVFGNVSADFVVELHCSDDCPEVPSTQPFINSSQVLINLFDELDRFRAVKD